MTNLPPPEQARRNLEQVVAQLNEKYGASATLPWQAPTRAVRHARVKSS